jgi:hypothetical protein
MCPRPSCRMMNSWLKGKLQKPRKLNQDGHRLTEDRVGMIWRLPTELNERVVEEAPELRWTRPPRFSVPGWRPRSGDPWALIG